ncbi:hypothetical protein [Aquabacter sediminis]|uniref:hypothetical protein n=1 Tax=Aquabacter sediminis TaxID=3029197 RepID=UPI00237DCE1F|nr:hypothetical protein [Aquabacter sp. P-9]MDE1568136.1 hypothetical protein [Aquabacter sp. P-9]
MRYLTIAPLALAAAIGFASIAQADEYTTEQNKENYTVAAQTGPAYEAAPLAYATPAHQANPLAQMPAPQPTAADQITFKIGDRGLGTN